MPKMCTFPPFHDLVLYTPETFLACFILLALCFHLLVDGQLDLLWKHVQVIADSAKGSCDSGVVYLLVLKRFG